MRNNGRGGMQTSRASYSIYCPLCGRPAATMTTTGNETAYLHFTRKGSVRHIFDGFAWRRKRT